MPIGCANRDRMGLDFGLEDPNTCFKQNNRWLFQIEGISAAANALPPLKASRPQLEFKEQQIAHLVQNIYYPIMAEWKPITLTLYDIRSDFNPVFEWVRQIYDPNGVTEWRPVFTRNAISEASNFKRTGLLCLYDGCGSVIEKWKFENCYPQAVNWGELNMAESNIVTVDITLRYDRAYVN